MEKYKDYYKIIEENKNLYEKITELKNKICQLSKRINELEENQCTGHVSDYIPKPHCHGNGINIAIENEVNNYVGVPNNKPSNCNKPDSYNNNTQSNCKPHCNISPKRRNPNGYIKEYEERERTLINNIKYSSSFNVFIHNYRLFDI